MTMKSKSVYLKLVKIYMQTTSSSVDTSDKLKGQTVNRSEAIANYRNGESDDQIKSKVL